MCGPCPTNAVCNECRVQRTHPVGLYFLETSLIRYFIRYRVSEPRFQAKVYERKRGAVVVYVAGMVGKLQDARQWYPSGPLLPTITDPLRAVPSNLFPRCPGCLSRIGHHRFCPRQEGPQARGACSTSPHAPGPQQGLLPGNVPSGSVHRIVLSLYFLPFFVCCTPRVCQSYGLRMHCPPVGGGTSAWRCHEWPKDGCMSHSSMVYTYIARSRPPPTLEVGGEVGGGRGGGGGG